MRYHEIVDEYQMIQDPGFKMPDFSKGHHVGIIQTGVGPLQVWKLADQDQVAYAAIDIKTGPTSPVSFIGFQIGQNLLMARNALTITTHQRKGISAELFLFVNKVEGHKIMSDTQLTTGGEALWISLSNSPKFSVKIVYLPTSELFDISAIGNATTKDGNAVVSPKLDNRDQNVFDNTTGIGQKFFYLIEAKDQFFVEIDGIIHESKMDISRNKWLGNLLQPPRYFTNDDP